MDAAALVLLPWTDARSALGDRRVALTVLAPPYPALGEGCLRVLRVRSAGDGALDVVCGYEPYLRR